MTDIMEARRKGFEFSLNRDWREADANLTRHGEGYMIYAVDCAWWAWNAALESVCVELPRVPNFDISAEESLEMDPDDYEALEAQHSYMVDVYRECRLSIERAGLKVKL